MGRAENGGRARAPDRTAPEEQLRLRIAPLAEEWDRLADRLRAAPFLRPGWFEAWWRAFGRGELVVHTVHREGRLAGVVPMARHRGVLRATANQHSPGFGLLAEDRPTAGELVRAALARAPRRLQLDFLDGAGPDPAEALTTARSAGYRVLSRTQRRTPYLDLTGDWASYLAHRSRNLRKELRRDRRGLDRLGTAAFEVVDGRDRLSERLEQVLSVESSGWKGAAGTAIASKPETRHFYEDVAGWAAPRGFLRIFFLRLDDRPIAVDYALEDAGIRYMLKGGFDHAYSRFSPGTILLEAGLSNAFDVGLDRVELGGGDDPYKLRWAEAVRDRRLVQTFAPSPLGLAEWAAFSYGRPVAKRLSRVLPAGSPHPRPRSRAWRQTPRSRA
jgi:CelD/BcsL family acetyltransferase involved in cellulose biosynthesis